MKKQNNTQIAMRVSVISIVGNILLFAFKFIAGILARSTALISDAIHSASDMLSTFIVMIGIKLSAKKKDRDHNYGHERIECVASIFLAIILGATGIAMGYSATMEMVNQTESVVTSFSTLALVAAAVSILTKEGMYWITRSAAKKINSSALKADAWHHRSDALSSIASLIAIVGVKMGFPILDKIAGLVICAFILKVAFDIFFEAIGKMTDKACDKETEQKLIETAKSVEGVKNVDVIRTRLFADRIYVDIEISACGELSLSEGHQIAEKVHSKIEENFKTVKHCMVHVNPYNENNPSIEKDDII